MERGRGLAMRTLAIGFCMVVASVVPAVPSSAVNPTANVVWPTAAAANAALGKGMNIVTEDGNYPDGGEQIDVTTGADVAVAGGFTSVRYPVRWFGAMQTTPPYTIDPAFLASVDAELDVFLAHHLTVVMNNVSPIESAAKFQALWSQVAAHFANRPPSVYFELANEPTWKYSNPPDFSTANLLDASEWNPLVANVLPIIRATNPERTVVVSAPDQSFPQSVPQLSLPSDDPHLIATFHQYQPLQFTHQGAGWIAGSDAWLGTTWDGSPTETAPLEATMNNAVCWSRQSGVPLYLGEFGTYYTGDMASRARYTAAVARLAEAEHISWAYFELSSGGFGVWDRTAKQWREPLYRALAPAAPVPTPSWASCGTKSFPLPGPGQCRAAGALTPSGLPLITDEAMQVIAKQPTAFTPTITVHAPQTVAAGGVIPFNATIDVDVGSLVRQVLVSQVRPIVLAKYGAGLADSAWVTMGLTGLNALIPLPAGTSPLGTPTATSTGPSVTVGWTGEGLLLSIGSIHEDSRAAGHPFRLTVHGSVRVPGAGAGGSVQLTSGPLRFNLDLGIGVSLSGSPLTGDITGPWTCQPAPVVLASTAVSSTTVPQSHPATPTIGLPHFTG